MMSQDIFRKKAVSANSDNRLGEIWIAQPLGPWVIAGIAMAFVMVVVLVLTLGSYSRKTEVSGRLVPSSGMSSITAPATGTLAQLLVKEGQVVQKGERLAIVDVDRNIVDGRDANAAILISMQDRRERLRSEIAEQAELSGIQLRSLQIQMESSKSERFNLQRELGIRRQQADLSKETLLRYQSLVTQNYVSHVQVAQQEQMLLEQLASIESIERSIAGLNRNIAQASQAIEEIPSKDRISVSKVLRDISVLDQDILAGSAGSQLLIVARLSGRVSNKLVEAGQAVQVGQPILTIVPKDSTLFAHLLVPSSAVGLMRNGDEVQLRYRAFPFQKFGQQRGRIVDIAQTSLSPKEFSGMTGESSPQDSLYRVIAEVDRQHISGSSGTYPLRPGMDVDARVVGERRALWEWIFKRRVD